MLRPQRMLGILESLVDVAPSSMELSTILNLYRRKANSQGESVGSGLDFGGGGGGAGTDRGRPAGRLPAWIPTIGFILLSRNEMRYFFKFRKY